MLNKNLNALEIKNNRLYIFVAILFGDQFIIPLDTFVMLLNVDTNEKYVYHFFCWANACKMNTCLLTDLYLNK